MEYQAKELFAKHGVTTTLGIVVTTPEEARAAAEKLGFCVVKAQVKAGGRGKAGGVKLAKTPDEAFEHASNILGMEIKGLTVNRVLITPATPPVEEYYFSFLLDRANRQYLCIASVEGGVEIEEVAKTNPDAVKQIPINPGTGVDAEKAREIATEAKFPEAVFEQAVTMIEALFRVFTEEDATLVEVNPLARLEGDKLEALDGKISLDDNASEVRHPDHEQFEIKDETDPLEAKAKERGLNYVKLDGQVGIIGNGAGLVMSTLDVVAYAGEKHGGVKPANFLDIGGGANAQVMADGLDVILHDAQVKSVFVNVFGGITACDEVANGIKGALEILGDEASKPLVVRLDGNNVAEGRRILDELNHPLVTQVPTMDGAADKAAELANTLRSESMSIYLNKDSKIIVQGMTGGMGSKHTTLMLDAGSNIVGGVNARKAGTTVELGGQELPVFGSVKEAMTETGADVSVVFVPPAFTKDACIEAIDAGIGLLVVITEGVPVQDTAEVWAYLEGKSTRMIGPNCPGIITPGESLAGITPHTIAGKGPIGLVSKSGTLTYQMMYELKDFGFTTAIGIGGDPVVGTTHIDALAAFEADPDTQAIVMIGEIGGDAEERAAAYIKDHVTKPVVGYVAGFTAPEGKTMGHAGAIVSGSSGTAAAKKEALEAVGVKVGKTPSETAALMREILQSL